MLLSCVHLFATPWSVQGVLWARILEWVAIPSSRGSSRPWDRTRGSWTAGRLFCRLSHTPRLLFEESLVNSCQILNKAGERGRQGFFTFLLHTRDFCTFHVHNNFKNTFFVKIFLVSVWPKKPKKMLRRNVFFFNDYENEKYENLWHMK